MPTVVATTIGAVVAPVPWTDESGLVFTVCLGKVGAAASAAVGVGNELDILGPVVGTATLCVGDDSSVAGSVFAVCVGNNAGTVLAFGDEADGSALGTLLALKEGKAVGKSPGPAVRNVEGSSDGPELEGDMERSTG